MIDEKKRISVFGIRQNCYRFCGGRVSDVTLSPNKTQKKYTILERKTLPNGYVDEMVERDYPINSESVTSYADSADYRNDPAQAVANAPKRVNLGDLTEAQAFLANPQNQARVCKDTLDKLKVYYNSVVKTDKADKTTTSQSEEVK